MVSPDIPAESVFLTVRRWQDTKHTRDFFAAADADGDITDDI
jgi:hypothetical protein